MTTTDLPDRTPALADATVGDAMHPGLLTCPRVTPLPAVARMMASYRVHCVVVYDERDDASDGGLIWGIVSDLDLAAAVAAGALAEGTAGQIAATPVLAISPGEPVERAAQLMAEHGAGHLVVVEPSTNQPVGVISTLDVARLAAGPA